MRNCRYIFLIIILFSTNSCDFAKRKVKSGINKMAQEMGDLIDEFLTLPDRTIKRYINDNELYGDWIITGQSIQNLDKQKADHPDWESITFPSLRFNLNEDRSVEAWIYEKYLSLSIFDYHEIIIDSILISGNWTIDREKLNNDDSELIYKNKLNLRFEFEGNKSFIVDLDISEQEKNLILWSYIGDPDNLYYQEYKKK